MVKSAFVSAFIVACFALMVIYTITGCSTLKPASVRYYKPLLKQWDGVLLGDQPAHDLDAKAACAPNMDDQGRCVIMRSKDFFDFKRQCSEALQATSIQEPELDQ